MRRSAFQVHVLVASMLLCTGLFASATFGADVSITATVPSETPPAPNNPVVEFHGVAAPDVPVTVTRGTTELITVRAAADATFDITLSDQPAGQQTYVVSATDAQNHALAPVTFALNLVVGGTTIVNGVFLGPSIAIDATTVQLGGTVTVSGTTAPSSNVTISIQSADVQYTVTAGSTGAWSKAIDTDDVGEGTHSLRARATTTTNVISAYSTSLTFTVTAVPSPGEQPVPGEPEPEPEEKPSPKRADLDEDEKIDLVDFSILLYYWKQKNPANPRADINKDGIVDLTDFSIMLYQWTG